MNKELICYSIIACVEFSITIQPGVVMGDGEIRDIDFKCADNASVNTLDALNSDLQKAVSVPDKVDVIRKIAVLPDALIKGLLLDYYRKTPSKKPGTQSQEVVKVELLRAVLPSLGKEERTQFLSEVILEEVAALKKAKLANCDRYYSKEVLMAVIQSCLREGMSVTERDILLNLSSDRTIPDSTRSIFLASVIRHDLDQDKLKTLTEKAMSVIDIIPTRPMMSIPWKSYNDKEKRIAYGKSKEFLALLERGRKWRMSDDSIRTEAYESVLESYGLVSVKQILVVLKQKNIDKERRDYLALVAASILSRLPSLQTQEREFALGLVNELEIYIEKMEDDGAGSSRNVAISALCVFYKKAAVQKFHQFREGGSVRAVVLGFATNAVPPIRQVNVAQRPCPLYKLRVICWFGIGGTISVLFLMWLFRKLWRRNRLMAPEELDSGSISRF